MVNKYLVMLAAGCVAANAASMNNYDLLGRKGSKMNSPMVYKNVDYSKVKKNEQQKVGSSLENRGLAKTGLVNSDVAGIEGVYNPRNTTGKKFEFRKYTYSGGSYEGCNNSSSDYASTLCTWSEYKNAVNNSVVGNLKIIERHLSQPASVDYRIHENYPGFYWAHTDPYRNLNTNVPAGTGWSNVEANGYTIEFYNSTPLSGYPHYKNVKNVKSKANKITNWLDSQSSEVGVFMAADALPVHLGWLTNGKFAGYIRNNGNVYQPVPGYEIRESRTLSLIKTASSHDADFKSHAVVYVGKDNVSNTNPSPTCNSTNVCPPQVYMGVRSNDIGTKHYNSYNTKAQALDDYIYQYRTAEFVPSGNYGQHYASESPEMFARAYAANAITVGALDKNGKVANMTSIASHGMYSSPSVYQGVNKPEVYNFAQFQDTSDLVRRYKIGNLQWDKTFYDSTEVAAAYTAGMVSNLLATNPFYRWHPEVVKAVLLTSNGQKIATPYVDNQVTTTAPSYEFLVFNDSKANRIGYNSRYWNGDFEKLRTAVLSDEIFFVIENNEHKGHAFRAAIAWLNAGSDIANNNGATPQDFDLYVYGKNGSQPTPYELGAQIGQSQSTFNSFERVEVPASKSNYDWLAFRIKLWSDKTSGANQRQIVLGFNIATDDIYQ